MIRRFTADASHELRTPLTALRAVGEVALSGERDEGRLRETIGSMLEEAQRLDALIESLLTLARLEGETVNVKREVVDLSALVPETVDSLQLLAQQKSQMLQVDVSQDVVAAADPVLVRQALLNIVHNAIRYSPRRSRIAIKVERVASQARITVADQGPGIPAEDQGKIFTRFFRGDKARSHTDGGFGLGLAIAKWSIERQDGRIDVDSGPGGSTFSIWLPTMESLKEA